MIHSLAELEYSWPLSLFLKDEIWRQWQTRCLTYLGAADENGAACLERSQVVHVLPEHREDEFFRRWHAPLEQ